MLKFIVNGLMRAMLKYVRVCTPGASPVSKEACMLVHENKWRFIRNLGGTAEIIVFVLYMDKGFFYFNFTKMRGI
jgi:hypothetical protein